MQVEIGHDEEVLGLTKSAEASTVVTSMSRRSLEHCYKALVSECYGRPTNSCFEPAFIQILLEPVTETRSWTSKFEAEDDITRYAVREEPSSAWCVYGTNDQESGGTWGCDAQR
jgi:hypothetical protein